MIVNDLHLVRIPFPPDEADTPSIVDPDTVLTFSIPQQLLQTIAGRYSEVL
jgi:hypothetical protein